MHIYTYTCRIHIDAIIKTCDTIYTSHFILKVACEKELETEQNCNILTPPPLFWPSALCLSRSPGLLNRRTSGPTLLGAGFLYRILSPTGLVSKLVSKLTDFLSSSSYIILQSPTQYLPITGHRDVSLSLSLEWHV